MIRTETTMTAAAQQLRAFVERIERVEEEIKELNADKSDIYKELRGVGFDVKAIRKVIAKRKLEPAERQEQDAIFDMYWAALHPGEDDGLVHVHARGKQDTSGESRERQKAGTKPASKPEAPLSSVVSAETAAVTPISRPRPELRPHCQNKQACAGVGFEHCYPCKKAAGLVGAAA